ncbi:hypothetical protein Tco_0045633 [Tanacetum coccineum]
MDWLSKYQAVIVCAEKIVRIHWGNETLIIHGDGSNPGNATRLNIISCTKTQKYMEKGFPIFLAHVTAKEVEGKSEMKRLEDVSIVQDFPEVFPEDLAGPSSTRQVEFQLIWYWCCTCSNGHLSIATVRRRTRPSLFTFHRIKPWSPSKMILVYRMFLAHILFQPPLTAVSPNVAVVTT